MIIRDDVDLSRESPWARTTLSEALAQVELELRLAMALRDHRALRLRVLDGQLIAALELPLAAGWIWLSADRLSVTRIMPEDHALLARRSFGDLLADPTFAADPAERALLEAAHGEARDLVVSLMDDDRARFDALREWAPLIEAGVYRATVMLGDALDQQRRSLRLALSSGGSDVDAMLANYRRLVDILGRMTLLATETPAKWRASMATRFVWQAWTPSFPTVRERDEWSALIGARAAALFGTAVIEGYFNALARARHPTMALDALLALTAIGLAHPAERAPITRALARDRANLPNRATARLDMVAVGYAEAERTLVDGKAVPQPTFSRAADAFAFDRAGGLPIFGRIVGALDAEPWRFIAPIPGAGALAPRVVREGFERAWGSPVDLRSLPVSAFGRA